MVEMKKAPKVLIVDDEPALLDIYSTKLSMEGFQVAVAHDGIEGIQQAVQFKPEIILLDVVMPLKDGFETLQDLKMNTSTKDIPVIILSNLGQDYEVKRGMALGAKYFLTKANLSPQRVVDEIRRALPMAA